MANIEFKQTSNAFGTPGGEVYAVEAGDDAIAAGDLVLVEALGEDSVILATDNAPIVGTDYVVGVAASASTQTASVAGAVRVVVLDSDTTILMTPTNPTAWDTQSEYDALVGARVQMTVSAGVMTIDNTDNSTYGFVVEPLDIKVTPAKVALKMRAAAGYLGAPAV